MLYVVLDAGSDEIVAVYDNEEGVKELKEKFPSNDLYVEKKELNKLYKNLLEK